MTVTLWRIAAETRDYRAEDLSGTGASKSPGRWNNPGEFVVYAATSRALAILETSAYINAAGLPLNRFLIEVAVPDDIWEARTRLVATSLHPAWCAIPAGLASVNAGSAWYQSQDSVLLDVPSVIVPEESAVLIHAKHPDTRRLNVSVVRKFEYDAIFR